MLFTKASRPTSGGCCSTDGSSSCAGPAGATTVDRRRDGTPRGLGRRLPARGTRRAATSRTGRGASAGRMLRVPSVGARRAGALVVPLRRPPHRGLLPDRAHHGHRLASARVADRPRHDGRRARPRAQQPGVGDMRARSTRSQETADELLSSLVRLAERSLPADQFIALGEPPPRSWDRRPPATTHSRWPTAKRRWRTGWPITTSTRGGASPRRSRPPASDVDWCERVAAVLDGSHARTGPRMGRRHAEHHGCCSPR